LSWVEQGLTSHSTQIRLSQQMVTLH